MKVQTIKISGMSCSGCANMVAENLSRLQGVHNVTVNLEDSSATVRYESAELTPAHFKRTVEDAGYTFEGMR